MKKKRFQKIYIEIINRCNLSCSFCPTSDRPARMMSVDEFAKIAAQVTPFTDYICLHVKGEPLMHPWLGDILTIAHQNELKVNLTTNALLLPEKHQLLLVAKALVSFGSTIQIPESEADIARCCHCKSPGKINGILKIGAEIPGMHGIGIKAVQGQRNLTGCCFAQKQLMFFGKKNALVVRLTFNSF